MNNLQSITLDHITFFPPVVQRQAEELLLKMNASVEAAIWHEVSLGYATIHVPEIIYNERLPQKYIEMCGHIEKQQYYCLFSRHFQWKVRIDALRQLQKMDALYDWTIPFLMLGTADYSMEVQQLSRQLLSTFDAREIERISYHNVSFLHAIKTLAMQKPY